FASQPGRARHDLRPPAREPKKNPCSCRCFSYVMRRALIEVPTLRTEREATMKRHVALLAAAILCLAAIPAGATIHLGRDYDKDHGKSVLLHDGPDDHGKLGKPLPLIHIPKFDLSDLEHHDNGKHLGWFKKLKDLKDRFHHIKPGKPGGDGEGEGGGPTHP